MLWCFPNLVSDWVVFCQLCMTIHSFPVLDFSLPNMYATVYISVSSQYIFLYDHAKKSVTFFMYDHPVCGHFMYDPSFSLKNCVWSYTFLKCMILPYFARHHTIIKDSAYIKSMFVPAIWWCWPYSLKRRTIHYKRRTIHCKRRTIQFKRRTIQCKRRTMLNKV